MYKILLLASVFFTSCAFLTTAPSSGLLDQINDEPPGRIEFIGDAGSPNVFTFERWGFTEVANAHDPENIQLTAVFDIASLQCDWTDLQESILSKRDYFFVKRFPEATISIDGAEALSDGSYQTQAMLTLKGISQPVTLTFTISEEAPYEIHAEGVIQRRNFRFTGNGPLDEVPVKVDAALQ